MSGNIRFASPEDAKAMLAIYAPYVAGTSISFEYSVPTEKEFRSRIANIMEKYPWFVYEEGGAILGYAYGGPDHTRDAYQWTVECSIYISEAAKGRGVGSALYDVLFDCLQKQNFCLCYALIVDDNGPSLRLHEKYGFAQNGWAKKTGFKLGAWHGVITLEKLLNEQTVPPKAVVPIGELCYEIPDFLSLR